MTLLTPLGLLGLIGLIVLIIIYIIKPNYQQKMVSSTYIWKLSLKYRKKKIPISKLRNILLIICQVLIITACALILAQPNKVLKSQVEAPEVIAIIDASASMRTQIDKENRFERAVNKALELSESTLNKNGYVSVILADTKASFLAQRVTLTNKLMIEDALLPLIEEDLCSYGVADVAGAIALCEEVLVENPNAKIHLYTDTTYAYVPEGIVIEPVVDEDEWNAAILDAYAEVDQNYYSFTVDVACYGVDHNVEVRVEVQEANAMDRDDTGSTMVFSTTVFCRADQKKRIVFINADLYEENANTSEDIDYYLIDTQDRVFSYQSVHISLNESDSFAEDNSFNIYGGQREVIKVQYASAQPNTFFNDSLYALKGYYSKINRWDIQITEVKKGAEFAMEGFDFYIFEHQMPETMPKDGVVFLVNPDPQLGNAPAGSGIQLKGYQEYGKDVYLMAEDETHPLLKYTDVGNVAVQTHIAAAYDSEYQVLASCANNPVLLLKENENSKVLVMGFSVHLSNLTISKEFPMLMYNVFEYFFPATVEGNSFEVYESVLLNARGEELYVSRGAETVNKFEQFPATLNVDLPGTYVLTQTTFFGESVSESIYVKIPAVESDIFKDADSLPDPFTEQEDEDFFEDLLLYIAAALVAILFLEWWLQSRENM